MYPRSAAFLQLSSSRVFPHTHWKFMDPSTLDQLRCTRTRVTKPNPSRRDAFQSTAVRIFSRSSLNNENNTVVSDEPSSRDFARFLGRKHPLQIIFVGHNPSVQSWKESAPYAHKSNRFWKLLKESELAPEHLSAAEHFKKLPKALGIGFIDLFVTSGSDASQIGKEAEKDLTWRKEFLQRLRNGTDNKPPKILCCVSKIVARKLLGGWNGDYGCIGTGDKWGMIDLKETDIWVLPSTSGRAGLKWDQRLAPFLKLKATLDQMEIWVDNDENM